MADRFPGEIQIGGTLRVADHDPNDIDLFLGQCSEQPTEWGESGQRVALTLDTISQVIDEDTGFIIFRDDQARYGEFEELEELCCRLDLSFDRHSDARYEHDGESTRWRPGMERPLVEHVTQSGNPLIDRKRVEACLVIFQDGRVEDGIKALQDLVPDVAPLTKFEVDTGK